MFSLRVIQIFDALAVKVSRASAFRTAKPLCLMSAVGTTLLQSPGCNEGTARNATLGTHTDKSRVSSVGAALTARAFALCRCGSWLCVLVVAVVGEVLPLRSSRNVWKQITQGLRPGL